MQNISKAALATLLTIPSGFTACGTVPSARQNLLVATTADYRSCKVVETPHNTKKTPLRVYDFKRGILTESKKRRITLRRRFEKLSRRYSGDILHAYQFVRGAKGCKAPKLSTDIRRRMR